MEQRIYLVEISRGQYGDHVSWTDSAWTNPSDAESRKMEVEAWREEWRTQEAELPDGDVTDAEWDAYSEKVDKIQMANDAMSVRVIEVELNKRGEL
jgi:hypothetical protein